MFVLSVDLRIKPENVESFIARPSKTRPTRARNRVAGSSRARPIRQTGAGVLTRCT